MQITVSPRPGTLENARAFLVNAQGAAADVLNAKATAPDTYSTLTVGVQNAAQAAAELFAAPARSEFQDLVAARQQVIAGKQLLEKAMTTFRQELTEEITQARVLEHTRAAFDAFENAFEIIDND